jgi:hypothetical protein
MLKKMSLFTMFVTFSKRKYIEVSASAFAKDEDNYINSALQRMMIVTLSVYLVLNQH